MENKSLIAENERFRDERDALLRRFKEIHREIGVVLKHYGFMTEDVDDGR